MEFHKITNIFPLIEDAEFDALVLDINRSDIYHGMVANTPNA